MTRVSVRQRREIEERAEGRCEYCRTPLAFAPSDFAMEHIIPKVRGGETTLDNLALSCQACNSHKYTRVEWLDAESGETVPLYNPRQQLWTKHFGWSSDFTIIVGLTPVGRATIAALDTNRQSVINLRRVLVVAGEHPPHDREELE